MIRWFLAVAAVLLAGALFRPAYAADDEMKPGLVCEIFDMGTVEDFPTIPADKKATVKRVDKDINVDVGGDKWPGTELTDNFYIRWNGTIKIEKDGKYKFFTESDDGSRLFIDGKQVVDNGGAHSAEEKDGEVELKAGDHQIKVEFFEIGGDAVCKVSWQAPGGNKEIIPAKALSHKKSAE